MPDVRERDIRQAGVAARQTGPCGRAKVNLAR